MIKISPIFIFGLFIAELLQVFQLFEIAGYGFSILDGILLVIYINVFFQFFFLKRKFKFPDSRIIYALIGLYLAYIFSSIGILTWGGQEAFTQYFKTLSHFLFVLLLAFVILGTEIKIESYFNTIRLLVILSIFINLYAIYQLFARMFGLPFAFISISNAGFLTREFGTEVGQMDQIVLSFQNFYRATSIFSEPSAFASFNIWNLIFVLFPYFTKSKQFISNNILRTFIIILSLISLLISFSLSGLLMLTVIVSTLIFVEKVPVKKFILTFIISVIVLISADTFLSSYTKISIMNLFSQRIKGLVVKNKSGVGMTEGESVPKRLNSMKNAVNLFVASPIFGIGVGNTYNHPLSIERFADSSFFHILAETGIIGTFFFISLLFYLLKISIYLRKYRLKDGDETSAISTMQSIVLPYTLVFITLNMVLGNIIGWPSFWLYLSIILVTYRNTALLEEKEFIEK